MRREKLDQFLVLQMPEPPAPRREEPLNPLLVLITRHVQTAKPYALHGSDLIVRDWRDQVVDDEIVQKAFPPRSKMIMQRRAHVMS